MFGLGKCQHPFESLAVYKHTTSAPSEKYPEEFIAHNIHLFCRKCGAGNLEKYGTDGGLTIKYDETIGGHEGAMSRAMAYLKEVYSDTYQKEQE